MAEMPRMLSVVIDRSVVKVFKLPLLSKADREKVAIRTLFGYQQLTHILWSASGTKLTGSYERDTDIKDLAYAADLTGIILTRYARNLAFKT